MFVLLTQQPGCRLLCTDPRLHAALKFVAALAAVWRKHQLDRATVSQALIAAALCTIGAAYKYIGVG